jgi:NAD(P)-dependent dehydrogenase (short-subunit alcohol dehydrogenase family)
LDCWAVSAAAHQVGDLAGRCALVTGGSRGIGRAACVAFADAGADVVVHYNTQEQAAKQVAAEIRAAGRRSAVVRADVTNAAEVETMMRDVAAACTSSSTTRASTRRGHSSL